MGFDEHGPAYPEPYSCPVCGVRDADAYLRCYDGGCPDGRDQARFKRLASIYDPDAPKNEWEKQQPRNWADIVLSACFTALVLACLFFLFTGRAHAMNHGFDPNDKTVKWFESKMRPDSPPNSCCGKGDAYPVARYKRNEDHTWSVWLADGSAKKYPDGTTREAFDVNTEIVVPDNKVNPAEDDLDNPTDVGWIFMRVSNPTQVGTIYCLIIHDEGN